MPNGDPVWRRPGHFDRFEFTNLSAGPQTLTGLHFEFRDELDNLIWTADFQGPPVALAIGQSWDEIPLPTDAYGDTLKFTGHVDLEGGIGIDFDYVLQNQPHYAYIWQARLGVQTNAANVLVACGNVDFMSPLEASL